MKPTSVTDLVAAFLVSVVVDVCREPPRPREVRQAELDQEHDAEVDRLDQMVAGWDR